MRKKFYVDTAIWVDFYEDRKGFNGEPLGDYAFRLFSLILANDYGLVISDLIIKELEQIYSIPEINGMIKPFEKLLMKIYSSGETRLKAKNISKQRNVPFGDVLHALIAKSNNFILVTRDKHFKKLIDISNFYKPEELI